MIKTIPGFYVPHTSVHLLRCFTAGADSREDSDRPAAKRRRADSTEEQQQHPAAPAPGPSAAGQTAAASAPATVARGATLSAADRASLQQVLEQVDVWGKCYESADEAGGQAADAAAAESEGRVNFLPLPTAAGVDRALRLREMTFANKGLSNWSSGADHLLVPALTALTGACVLACTHT